MIIKRQDGFVLEHIHGQTYILPYGQNIADLKRGVLLNETGALLWDLLQTPKSIDELTNAMLAYYQIPSEDKAMLQDDVALFVEQSCRQGILKKEEAVTSYFPKHFLSIAKQKICIACPEQIFSKYFVPFCKNENDCKDDIDMYIDVIIGAPHIHQNGLVLLRNKELIILEREDSFILVFPTLSHILEAHISKDGRSVHIYCSGMLGDEMCEQLFLAIRPCFLYNAQRHNMFAIHSASILYQDKAWLFSGYSGMGKSTHTSLWHDLFGVSYLNGDLNLVGINEDTPVVYGIPWCGTSDIFTTDTYPLGGIVLLGRSDTDHLSPLAPYEKTLQVMQRMISPSWTAPLMECNLNCAMVLTEQIPVFHLLCTKNPSAAIFMKEQIDAL